MIPLQIKDKSAVSTPVDHLQPVDEITVVIYPFLPVSTYTIWGKKNMLELFFVLT